MRLMALLRDSTPMFSSHLEGSNNRFPTFHALLDTLYRCVQRLREPRCTWCALSPPTRLYFVLWIALMVFTGMMLVMVRHTYPFAVCVDICWKFHQVQVVLLLGCRLVILSSPTYFILKQRPCVRIPCRYVYHGSIAASDPSTCFFCTPTSRSSSRELLCQVHVFLGFVCSTCPPISPVDPLLL